jgi:hypothetical protein
VRASVICIGTTCKHFYKIGHDHCFSSTVSTFNLSLLSKCDVCGQTKQDRQLNTEARSRNHCCRGKAIRFTYSEFVSVALIIEHSMYVHHSMLISVACGLYHIFSTLFHKRHDFFKSVLILSLLSETFLILIRDERDIINLHSSSCQVPVVLVRF